MANPNIPVLDDDIRYEDRAGCFVLVDPARPDGRRDVASTWEETRDLWRWRMSDAQPTGEPHPKAISRDEALRAMLRAYVATDASLVTRLEAQRPRFSFGEPQIFRA